MAEAMHMEATRRARQVQKATLAKKQVGEGVDWLAVVDYVMHRRVKLLLIRCRIRWCQRVYPRISMLLHITAVA